MKCLMIHAVLILLSVQTSGSQTDGYDDVFWSGQYAAKYLSGYSSGANKFDTLAEAQYECSSRRASAEEVLYDDDCGGITFEPSSGKYSLRRGQELKDSPSKEISWTLDRDCLKKGDTGATYRGWYATTKSNWKCQRWDVISPNSHTLSPENNPNAGLEENYCRNPDGEPGPWCYNSEGTDPRWELCEIPQCPVYEAVKGNSGYCAWGSKYPCGSDNGCNFGCYYSRCWSQCNGVCSALPYNHDKVQVNCRGCREWCYVGGIDIPCRHDIDCEPARFRGCKSSCTV